MSFTVAAEHLTLTPSIREHVARCLAKIEPHVMNKGHTRVFVKRPLASTFTVLIRVKSGAKEWVAEETADDFYTAANGARDKMVRLIEKAKTRRIRRRERPEDASVA